MIRLTRKDGLSLYISPENLTSVGQSEVSKSNDPFDLQAGKELVTVVVCGEDSCVITESPSEVARKVLEYKLAMGDYRHLVGEYKIIARNVLEELAGLEDTNDA